MHKIIYKNYDETETFMEVSPKGGMINSLNYNGENILYPISLIEKKGMKKIRGGNFSCIPNFGVDEITNLNNHGYGRDLEWKVDFKNKEEINLYVRGIGDYKKLDTYLSYKLENNQFIMKLKFSNQGNKDIFIAPGFHPYFSSKDNFLLVEDRKYSKEELEKSVFIEKNYIEFETEKFKFSYTSEDFTTYVIWSDFLGDYVCVEPTYNGTSFKTGYKNKPYNLKSKEEIEFKIALNWEYKNTIS
ncbi:hypothetical protein [Miniphocaeibacter massiliensis]|uniref:aldose epimerase family protein n=1 Tax=Miniphocaeibacter massiliensis TaxID=2041841 RepID=UPI000C088227|nr:hypothetical protein [Miniphocaeibacter massiliensis]